MYGWYAWIRLAETTVEDDEGSLMLKLDQLRALVSEKHLYTVPANPVCAVNYDYLFQCSGSHNHRGDAHDRLVSIITWIADMLPGSHGLVYWYDDEKPGRDVFDGYKVMGVARGRILHRYDPFLSPINPVVED
jgi:hypothetical protein